MSLGNRRRKKKKKNYPWRHCPLSKEKIKFHLLPCNKEENFPPSSIATSFLSQLSSLKIRTLSIELKVKISKFFTSNPHFGKNLNLYPLRH